MVEVSDDALAADAATPDDVPEKCELEECDDDVENFPEAFLVPPELVEEADSEGRAVMCDHHHVAAKILAYTRGEPPYVDMGLYQEVTYYSRALASETFGIPASEKVTAPQHAQDEQTDGGP